MSLNLLLLLFQVDSLGISNMTTGLDSFAPTDSGCLLDTQLGKRGSGMVMNDAITPTSEFGIGLL